MNAAALLALLADLYAQVSTLTQDNAALREALAERDQPEAPTGP